MSQITLNALYYPYARCLNETTIKRAILIFDEIGFVDPTSPNMREALVNEKHKFPESVLKDWEVIQEAYGILIERGIVKIHDPEPLVKKHNKLLGAALQADLDDDNIWRLCTAPNTPTTWNILRRKVPTSAFEFLNSQPIGRINYGTAKAKAYFHQQFLRFPNFENDFLDKTSGPFHEGYIGDEQWLRYLFHDSRIARRRERYGLTDSMRRELYMQDVEISCVFPYTHGSSLAVNTALMLSNAEGLIPFTDSTLHHEMLSVKFSRVVKALETQEFPFPISGVKQLHPEKLRRVAFTLLDVMVPDECIEQMSIGDCIKYRNACREASNRLRIYIGELASQIETEPWTDEFEKDMQKLLHQKILPEAQKAKDKGTEIYEKLFSKIIKRSASVLTPTLSTSIFTGLTLPLMLAVGSAAALGSILPDVIDALLEERTFRRNSLLYLLKLNK
ncbi:MAG: hypothetical protein AAGB19_03820 [Cyanobacteria bacterium P01_F01_bin.3]